MSKTLKIISIVLFFISLLPIISSQAQTTDSIRIVTYYPSPYGSYAELRSKKLAVGTGYINAGTLSWNTGGPCMPNEICNADLVVEGNVGIGTEKPETKLDVLTDFYARLQSGKNVGEMTLGPMTGYLYQFIGGQQGADGESTGQAQGGFGILSGQHQLSPIIWMYAYGDGRNAFQVRTKMYGDTVQNGSVLFHIATTGNVGIGTTEPQAKLDVAGDGSTIIVPRKSTAGDPAGVNGMIYYNTNSNRFRVFENGAWKNLVSGVWVSTWTEVKKDILTPIDWEDLDLSGIVGNRRALVVLKWVCEANNMIRLRSSTDTFDYWVNDNFAANKIYNQGYGIVETDDNGHIQWTGNAPKQYTTYTLTVIGYIPS